MHPFVQPVAAGVSPQAVPAASRRKDPNAGRTRSPGVFRSSHCRVFLILFGILHLDALLQAQEAQDLPKNIRVIIEYIETSHELVTEVMTSEHADSGPKLHARMRSLVKEDKARIMETAIMSSRSGQRASLESHGEFMSPSEYFHHGMCGMGFPNLPPPPRLEVPPLEERGNGLRPWWPNAFETRNVGVSLDIEPTFHYYSDRLIDLRVTPEIDELLRYETWVTHKDQWGDASVRRPTYGSLTTGFSLGMTLADGQWGFAGLLTPHHPDGGRDFSRKILLFVRADVLTIDS